MIILRWIALAVLLATCGHAAARARDEKSLRSFDEVEYLPRASVLSAVASGYDDAVADFLWLRSVLYYGELRRGDHRGAFYQELVNTVTDLDPRFEDAYRFGASVLADDLGQVDAGVSLLEKGMLNLPQSWWLPFEVGFIEYTVNMDDEQAYRWFQRAARVPGAEEYPRRFAAFLAGRAGDLAVSYELWRYVAATTPNDDMRAKAVDYMQQLEAAMKGEGPVPEWVSRKRAINGRVEG